MFFVFLVIVLVGCGKAEEEDRELERAYEEELAEIKEKVIRSDQEYRENKKTKREDDLLESLVESIEVSEDEQKEAEDGIDKRLITVSADFLEDLTPTSVRMLVNGEKQVFYGSKEQIKNLVSYEVDEVYIEFVEDKEGRKVIRRFGSAENSDPDWEEEDEIIEIDE